MVLGQNIGSKVILYIQENRGKVSWKPLLSYIYKKVKVVRIHLLPPKKALKP